jgi:hypothetical protein
MSTLCLLCSEDGGSYIIQKCNTYISTKLNCVPHLEAIFKFQRFLFIFTCNILIPNMQNVPEILPMGQCRYFSPFLQPTLGLDSKFTQFSSRVEPYFPRGFKLVVCVPFFIMLKQVFAFPCSLWTRYF